MSVTLSLVLERPGRARPDDKSMQWTARRVHAGGDPDRACASERQLLEAHAERRLVPAREVASGVGPELMIASESLDTLQGLVTPERLHLDEAVVAPELPVAPERLVTPERLVSEDRLANTHQDLPGPGVGTV